MISDRTVNKAQAAEKVSHEMSCRRTPSYRMFRRGLQEKGEFYKCGGQAA